jgi:hypothetical protein
MVVTRDKIFADFCCGNDQWHGTQRNLLVERVVYQKNRNGFGSILPLDPCGQKNNPHHPVACQ